MSGCLQFLGQVVFVFKNILEIFVFVFMSSFVSAQFRTLLLNLDNLKRIVNKLPTALDRS